MTREQKRIIQVAYQLYQDDHIKEYPSNVEQIMRGKDEGRKTNMVNLIKLKAKLAYGKRKLKMGLTMEELHRAAKRLAEVGRKALSK